MPTYKCNNHCSYCYNTYASRITRYEDNWIGVFNGMLSELVRYYNIERVELYGGDLGLVQPQKLEYIVRSYRRFCTNDVITCTNIDLAHGLGFPNERINLSLNPERKDWMHVRKLLNNIHNCGVITVVTKGLTNKKASLLLNKLRETGFQGMLTLMPFNWQPWHDRGQPYVSNFDYCSYVIEALNELSNGGYDFKISNKILIKQALEGTYTPYMENNIFITPHCSWACVDFETSGHYQGAEYFREFNSLKKWQEYCQKERTNRIFRCGTCEYFNSCLAEHCKTEAQLKVPERTDICNGYIPLIEWGKEHYGLGN